MKKSITNTILDYCGKGNFKDIGKHRFYTPEGFIQTTSGVCLALVPADFDKTYINTFRDQNNQEVQSTINLDWKKTISVNILKAGHFYLTNTISGTPVAISIKSKVASIVLGTEVKNRRFLINPDYLKPLNNVANTVVLVGDSAGTPIFYFITFTKSEDADTFVSDFYENMDLISFLKSNKQKIKFAYFVAGVLK